MPMPKGSIPWNKGKKWSEEVKQKMRKAKQGRCNGINNSFYGKHHTNETKKKISLAHKGKKRKPFTEETRQKMGKWQKGSGNNQWKGGKKKDSQGYIHLLKPEHPFSDIKGYILEHRIIMEQKIGRYLNSKEVIHHINGIKNDNRIENLRLFRNDIEHRKYHRHLKKL